MVAERVPEQTADLSQWLGRVHCGDALEFLRGLPDNCCDSVITDPPYAEISRPYGRLTEAEWWALIVDGVVPEVRRVLKPTGSAVFIIQPNSRKVGSMRGWVFEFMAWVCREWNMVQDAWWQNTSCPPTVHCHEKNGLMRPSLKPCVWCGSDRCYRDQSSVLKPIAEATLSDSRAGDYSLKHSPSGYTSRHGRAIARCIERGGATPFNVQQIGAGASDSAGNFGHGAGTPLPLMRWWTRYITPPGGVTCDPFMGVGTLGLAALAEGRRFVGCERDEYYYQVANHRIAEARRAAQPALIDER